MNLEFRQKFIKLEKIEYSDIKLLVYYAKEANSFNEGGTPCFFSCFKKFRLGNHPELVEILLAAKDHRIANYAKIIKEKT